MKSENFWAGVIAVVLVALIIGIDIAWNRYLYGDWTCAFAHCRKVVR